MIHWGHWMVLGSHERFSYGLFSFARTFYHNMRISFPCTRTVVTNQDPKLTFWQNYAYAYGPFSSRMDLYLSEQADHFVKRARTSFPPFYLRAFPVSRAVRPFLFHLKSGGGGKGYSGSLPKSGRGHSPRRALHPPMAPPLVLTPLFIYFRRQYLQPCVLLSHSIVGLFDTGNPWNNEFIDRPTTLA